MIEQHPAACGSASPVSDAGYTVTVRGLILMSSIGIRPREREPAQRIRDLDDLVAADAFPGE
jgi:hypothetical protein